MRKAKAKKAGSGSKKAEPAGPAPAATDEAPSSPATAEPTAADSPEKQEAHQESTEQPTEEFPPAPSEEAPAPATAEPAAAAATTSTPSLAQQSKARSTSFRQGSVFLSSAGPLSPGASASLGLFSPDGETAPDIYRKHVLRIEELEKENKALAREVEVAEKRWQKAEGELADLREQEGGAGGDDGEVGKLRTELAALQRQNTQLQAQLTRRHGSSPSISMSSPPNTSELEAQLRSKSATIETMELEMSRLRAQVERLSVSASTPSEQITALEEKLARADKAAGLAQRELHDLKIELEQASKRAVMEGSERASAETKLRALMREVADAVAARDELARKVEGLEKKVATLTTLHKEQDGRTQALRRDKEKYEKEVGELKERLERAEAENLRLRKKDAAEGGGDDEGVDELEEEERLRLERRVRELEAENTDLRRGIWHEKRKEMQVDLDEAAAVPSGAGHGRFETVDLGSGGLVSPPARKGAGGGGLGDLFASGLNALTGAATGGGHHDDLLEDGDMEFDEEAFRRAQEEEQKKRIERIKEIKRSLKNWEGWRLDLVENRRGGGEGIGEIFEI
ncbi:hypothetical protein C8A03DRAFT_40173 [Achaetomium macrosporum]|uniref:M protein repeat protein n=1 Tax=Achaetomium macrosporum TaxID=79813 RepID=A0AAN7HET0_9PEZI|nr:hypothetical protein C8A03DRAFT_40173 [Achaetomium macrosporum]